MLQWLKLKLVPALWKLEINSRMARLEEQQQDLMERFTRFQNRQNMRQARENGSSNARLSEEVAEVLAAAKNAPEPSQAAAGASAPPGVRNLDLWARRKAQ